MVEGHVLEQLYTDQSYFSVCLCVSVSEKSPAAPLPSGTSASSSQSEAAKTSMEVRHVCLQNKTVQRVRYSEVSLKKKKKKLNNTYKMNR